MSNKLLLLKTPQHLYAYVVPELLHYDDETLCPPNVSIDGLLKTADDNYKRRILQTNIEYPRKQHDKFQKEVSSLYWSHPWIH